VGAGARKQQAAAALLVAIVGWVREEEPGVRQRRAHHRIIRCNRALPGLTSGPLRPILHHMVNYHGRLNRTFAALGDPTRRAILAMLERDNDITVSELAKPFAIKLPAVMKHLDVLDDARLITRHKVGRTVSVRLAAKPLREAMNWLRRYERFWTHNLDRLAAYAESQEAKARKNQR
jgi:DNA-binding transcriptional ArsR family regulator